MQIKRKRGVTEADVSADMQDVTKRQPRVKPVVVWHKIQCEIVDERARKKGKKGSKRPQEFRKRAETTANVNAFANRGSTQQTRLTDAIKNGKRRERQANASVPPPPPPCTGPSLATLCVHLLSRELRGQR
eukprot:6086296-Pleurochrysis_carterae.AAC.1